MRASLAASGIRHGSPLLVLALLLAACTPALHDGRPAPFFVHDLPLHPDVDADGRLRAALPLPRAAADGTVPVDLPVALRVTAFAHPAVRGALEAVVQSRADHLTASLLPNPSLTAALTLLPLPGQPFNADTRQGGPPQLDIGVGVMLDELLFGKRAKARSMAELGIDVALAEYAEAARRRLLATIVEFHGALLGRELLQLERDQQAQLERIHQIIGQRVELGGTGRVELDRIRIASAAGRRRVLRAEAEYGDALARFRACLGDAVGAARAVPDGDLSTVPTAPLPPIEELLALAEGHRPDWIAATRGILVARAGVALQRKLAWPEFGIFGGYTRQYQQRAIGFPDANSIGGGFELSLPLFDRNQGNVLRAASEVRAAELTQRALQLELHVEVESAHRAFLVTRAIVQSIDSEELTAAERARASIDDAYRFGGRTLLELLDAQAAYRETQRDHLLAHAELWSALHVLNAVVGTEVLASGPASSDH